MRRFGLGIIFIVILTCLAFSCEKIWKKLEIDLYGGFSILNPTDLNTWSDMNEKTDKFHNDDFFNYQASPLLVVKADDLDFSRKEDVEDLIVKIEQMKKDTLNYVPLSKSSKE